MRVWIEDVGMKKTFGLICATLVAIVTFIVDSQSFPQDLPSCGDRPVTYSPFDEHLAANRATLPVAARYGNDGSAFNLRDAEVPTEMEKVERTDRS
jgi:hypothetical protein